MTFSTVHEFHNGAKTFLKSISFSSLVGQFSIATKAEIYLFCPKIMRHFWFPDHNNSGTSVESILIQFIGISNLLNEGKVEL